MLVIGLFTAACGLWLMLPEKVGGSGFDLSKWLVLPLVIAGTVGLLRLLPGEVGRNLHHQYRIFDNKPHLGDDRHLHDDVRLVHRLRGDLRARHQGGVRVLARDGGMGR